MLNTSEVVGFRFLAFCFSIGFSMLIQNSTSRVETYFLDFS